MYMKIIYYVFIIFLLLSKLAYLVSIGHMYYVKYETPNSPDVMILQKQSDRLLAIASVGIIIALLIDFGYSILRGKKKIQVNRVEQIIYFISGLLGLLHMNWQLIIFNN